MNRFSKEITQKKSQGASQAMLYATGLNENDLTKAQVGIVSNWYEGNPCNMHLNGLAQLVKEGITEASLIGLRFTTIGVSDGISMGTRGMSYSLQSRDLIADSIETVVSAQWYDGCVAIPGCDKNMPGAIMAMARLNRPSLMVYGGTIAPGKSETGDTLDVVSAFQSYGQYLAGQINEAQRKDIIRNSCPGPGACGGMYTANTMACAIEAMGMSLPYSSSAPAGSDQKKSECASVGMVMKNLLDKNIKPLDIMNKKSFENAIMITLVLGGSTNAVLHLVAMAKAAGVSLSIDEFNHFSQKIPFLADMKPSGRFVMKDLAKIGGTPAVLKELQKQGVLHDDILTVTGKTMKENLASLPELSKNQEIIRPWDQPLSKTGHLKILKGSLAPEGAVAKITGKEGRHFSGPAQVFDSEEDMLNALERGEIKKGSVVVIRYEGPKGGPGMPEMLTPTSAIVGAGLHNDIALITDGRFSGGSHGFIVGHVCPEAQEGGPIALIKSGDVISIDADHLTINHHLDVDELENRRNEWKPKPLKFSKGTLSRYVKTVSSASKGCTTD